MRYPIRFLAVIGAAAALPGNAGAQTAADSLATRPLATREALQRLLQQAGAGSALGTSIQTRLTIGDFRPGDRILLAVQGEPTLTDTFAVTRAQELVLPAPTVGAWSLKGILRAELEDSLAAFLARFLQNPVIRARALLRLSVQGEVARAGVYGVPADAKLGDALMAAGGTTPRADMRKLRIERDGRRVWTGSGTSLELAIDEVGLQDGDQITVAGHRTGAEGGLRSLWLLVSIAGGIYGISRAF